MVDQLFQILNTVQECDINRHIGQKTVFKDDGRDVIL